MHLVLSALVILFAVLMAPWPLAWLLVLIRHSLSRQWRRVGRVAWLLPIWTVAASVGAIQLGPLLAARDAAQPSPRVWVAATSLLVAMCIATVAWMLLVRSFGSRSSRNTSS